LPSQFVLVIEKQSRVILQKQSDEKHSIPIPTPISETNIGVFK
jgi:hypothetical protein